MAKIRKQMPLTLLLMALLLLSPAFVGIVFSQPTLVYVYPAERHIQICTEFTVEIRVSDVANLFGWQFRLTFDPVQVEFISITEGPFLKQGGPTYFFTFLDPGVVSAACVLINPGPGVSGSGTLAHIRFHCRFMGTSPLHLFDTMLVDPSGIEIGHTTADGIIMQILSDMTWKSSYADYAPSGVPDFDQRQDQWWNPLTGQWSWCGPVAVADSLWWMDSRFETSQTPPPTISETFALVKSYNTGIWDDHDVRNVDPFARDLAYLMDTDGQRTGIPHNGTNVLDMEAGIAHYMIKTGVNPKGDANGDGIVSLADYYLTWNAFGSMPGWPKWDLRADLYVDNKIDVKDMVLVLANLGKTGQFYERTVKTPTFEFIKSEVEKCEDVILLLGYWQWTGTAFVRVGGHYVTVAGVNSTHIAFSDPIQDMAEFMNLDNIFVPVPHPPGHMTDVHNDTLFVSHDPYPIGPSPSPGGTWGPQGYPEDLFPLYNGQNQNIPDEFKSISRPYYDYNEPLFAETEYAVVISPFEWYFKPPYVDYAPSGVADFDQRQDQWQNPLTGEWSYCGPTAVADSLWWLDSEHETGGIPPPTYSDNFPLVRTYGFWDDHDPLNVPPLIQRLANLMDTDGQRTGLWHVGTNVMDMQAGIAQYLSSTGLNPQGDANGDGVVNNADVAIVEAAYGSRPGDTTWNMAADLNQDNLVDTSDTMIVGTNYGNSTGKFYEKTVKSPSFDYIESEIEKCEDVELLVGFWQPDFSMPGGWVRVGGHYVTATGIDSTGGRIIISDPGLDNAEKGEPGIILPLEYSSYPLIPPPFPPHNHTGPPETSHNNASVVSHDIYLVGPSISPGGQYALIDYNASISHVSNYVYQNIPGEFLQYSRDYIDPNQPIYVEIEYAVAVSCRTGIVAAGSEDSGLYVLDFNGNMLWYYYTIGPIISVAMSNDAQYIAAGSRISDGPGMLYLFDQIGTLLWSRDVPISASYDGGWMGTESKSVDVKYSRYNGCVVVTAATDNGLFLFDQFGNLIWHYYDESPETIARISQDGNYIICASYYTGVAHYFSHVKDATPGWGPGDGTPLWSTGLEPSVFWVAISGLGDYVAVSTRFPDLVILLDRTGTTVWSHGLLKGGYVRVDMPCHGRSVVSVNDDPNQVVGCDLNYWSDGGNGWDGGDSIPVWSYWPGKEFGNGQNVNDDFYTVSISENGEYIATGGVPANTYVLDSGGNLQQTVGTMIGAVQSTDLTLTGKYGASVSRWGQLMFFSKDTGLLWSYWTSLEVPFHCVAVSKIYPCMFPYPDHDVDVHEVSPFRNAAYYGFRTRINVTLSNEGDSNETLNAKLWAQNSTHTFQIDERTVGLPPDTNLTIVMQWIPTAQFKGTFTMFVTIDIVQDEIDVYDNTLVNGTIRVSLVGDVNGDNYVGINDIFTIASHFAEDPNSPGWNPNLDINDDDYVGINDIFTAAQHFGEEDP